MQADAAVKPSAPLQPEQHLIVFNIGKKSNVGTIARCCTAFGAASLCVVGSRQINTFGAHGADAHVHMRNFPSLQDCCATLREQQGCSIVGIEIMDGAQPVQAHPFTGPTAFMLGNEGQGLSASQKAACDSFVYIPQHGVGTASLNVAVAASIVLHHFALWANYPERQREGEKFVVAPRPQLRAAKRCIPLTAAERAAARERNAASQPHDEAAAALQLQELLEPGAAAD